MNICDNLKSVRDRNILVEVNKNLYEIRKYTYLSFLKIDKSFTF